MKTRPKRIDIIRLELEQSYVLDENLAIYRYLGFDKFVHMIETNSLKFVRCKEWEDPHEGKIHRDEINYYNSLIEDRSERGAPVGIPESLKKFSSETLNYTFGTSWSLANDHDAMWRIYSSDKRGLMIKSTLKKIESSIKNISLKPNCCLFYSIGKVTYDKKKECNNLEGWFNKRRAFDHEQEVRAVIRVSAPAPMITGYFGGKVTYSPITSALIDEVVIDPRASDWHVESVRSYCKSKEIDKVSKSSLYDKLE